MFVRIEFIGGKKLDIVSLKHSGSSYSLSMSVPTYIHSDPMSIGIFEKFPCIAGLLMEPSRFNAFDLRNEV